MMTTASMQQMASNKASTEFKILCGICQRPYYQPKILPCLHTFCAPCILDLPTNSLSDESNQEREDVVAELTPSEKYRVEVKRVLKESGVQNYKTAGVKKSSTRRMRSASSEEHLTSTFHHVQHGFGLSASESGSQATLVSRSVNRSQSYKEEETRVSRRSAAHRSCSHLGRQSRQSTSTHDNGSHKIVHRSSSLKDEKRFRGRKSSPYSSVVTFYTPREEMGSYNLKRHENSQHSYHGVRIILCPACLKEVAISQDLRELPRNFMLERLVAKEDKLHCKALPLDFHCKHHEGTEKEVEAIARETDIDHINKIAANGFVDNTLKTKNRTVSRTMSQDRKRGNSHRIVKLLEFSVSSKKVFPIEADTVDGGVEVQDLEQCCAPPDESALSSNIDGASRDTEHTIGEENEESNEPLNEKTKNSSRIVKKLKLPKLFHFGKFRRNSNNTNGNGSENSSSVKDANNQPTSPTTVSESITKTSVTNHHDNDPLATGPQQDCNHDNNIHVMSNTLRGDYGHNETSNYSLVSQALVPNELCAFIPDIVDQAQENGVLLSSNLMTPSSPEDDEVSSYFKDTQILNGYRYDSRIYDATVEPRQRRTVLSSSREIIVRSENTIDDAPEDEITWPLTCERHPGQELTHFCLTCDLCLCRGCVVTLHPRHDCRNLTRQLFQEQMAEIDNLIRSAVPKVKDVERQLNDLSFFKSKVKDRTSEVTQEINEIMDLYVAAVQKHRQNLLNQVKALHQSKESFLNETEENLQQTHRDVQQTCRFVSELLKTASSDVEILSMKGLISRRLASLLNTPQEPPRMGSFLRSLKLPESHARGLARSSPGAAHGQGKTEGNVFVSANQFSICTALCYLRQLWPVLSLNIDTCPCRVREWFRAKDKGDIINNFQLFGRIVEFEASAIKSYISGDGLALVRIGRTAAIGLTVCDDYGLPYRGSDVTVKAWLQPLKDQTNNPPPIAVGLQVAGEYRLQFTPICKGLHLMHVAVNGEAIKGSPFKFNVKSRWRQHHGTWQCCTVCSSGGRGDVPCGCGGTIGGGYVGCHHDHPTHPGGQHWSCCGKMTIESECGSSMSTGHRTAPSVRQFSL